MKKLLIIAAVATALLAGCSDYFTSNRRIWHDGNHNFNRAYVRMGNEWKEFHITSWCDYQSGDEVQLWTADGKCILTHYANVVLINDAPRH